MNKKFAIVLAFLSAVALTFVCGPTRRAMADAVSRYWAPASGALPPAAIQCGGSDGTLLRVPTVQADGSPPNANLFASVAGGSDGTNVKAFRTGSAANQVAAIGGNISLLATEPGTTTIVHEPAAAAQATISAAAGAAGVRHVLKSASFTYACGATAGTPLFVRIRDGACGAGTIKWTGAVACPVNGVGVVTTPPGLTIAGTAATALCAEFSAAGVAASQEAVSAAYYDSN